MKSKLELYGELELLIREDEISLLPKGIEGDVYPVEEATVEDLEELNSLPLKDVSSVADVKEMLNEIWFTLGQKCTNGEYLDVEDYNVIYNHQEKRFISVSDLEVEPVYIYYDGNDWISMWLPEPDHIVEVDDEETISLDGWNGSKDIYGRSNGCYAEALPICQIDGKPVEDKYLIHYWSTYMGNEPTGEIISEKELQDIVNEMKGEMEEVKEARLKAGLTQKQMSVLLGIPKRTIEDWERGIFSPPEYTKKMLVKELESIYKGKGQ